MSPARPLPGGSARLYPSHAADRRWRMTADGGYCEQGSPGDDRTIHTMTAFIDLRSDTVTRPTEAMRNAMAEAEVGDDWYGDDPTVNRLQHRAAEITGRQAALYLPTGTMCTQIALHAFVRSGHVVVCESAAHVFGMESQSAAVLSGVTFRPVPAARGLLTADQVAAALRPDPDDITVVDLVTIENSHQVGGGSVQPVEEARAIAKACDAAAVPLDPH